MQIGAMNHPARDPLEEIRLFSSLGLEFVDFTLEPPCAAPWRVDPNVIRHTFEELGLNVVGHTAFYLPLASPFEGLRRAAVDELKKCIDVFSTIGAVWMNVHPDPRAHFHSRSFVVKQNIESMRELIEHGKPQGVGIMVENIPGEFNNAKNLGELLDALPDLGLHLDIGHCNLLVPANTTGEILNRYGDRVKHVHVHDNNGGNADLHLPLGTGTMDFGHNLDLLKRTGYDGTITLEVFSEDKHYLEYSRDILRKLWG